jgi:hypothetical protein
MHLKYLSLCLFSLGLTACAQHNLRPSVPSTQLDQKVIQGMNAIYEYPSYDYRGHFKVSVDPNQSKKINNVEKTVQLDAAVQKKSRSIFT